MFIDSSLPLYLTFAPLAAGSQFLQRQRACRCADFFTSAFSLQPSNFTSAFSLQHSAFE
jgi:hypothetical protein